jgi:hypothetical protein
MSPCCQCEVDVENFVVIERVMMEKMHSEGEATKNPRYESRVACKLFVGYPCLLFIPYLSALRWSCTLGTVR